MDQITIRTDSYQTDLVTGRFTENRTGWKIDRTSLAYLRASINRLEIICDRPLGDKEAICQALMDYGYCLPTEQRVALKAYCG